MLIGLLPWKNEVLKKEMFLSDEKILLRNGWNYLKYGKISDLRDRGPCRLLYKIISPPKKFPHLPHLKDFLDSIHSPWSYKDYRYIEVMSVSVFDGSAQRYGKGNFYIGKSPFSVASSQVVKCEEDELPEELKRS